MNRQFTQTSEQTRRRTVPLRSAIYQTVSNTDFQQGDPMLRNAFVVCLMALAGQAYAGLIGTAHEPGTLALLGAGLLGLVLLRSRK